MKKFTLDTVLCTIFIFGILGVFASLPLLKVFEAFDPIGEMFSDFELTDVVFSQMREEPIADEELVIVNIGELNREGIAHQIEIISKYNPKAIGLDVLLDEPQTWENDSMLTRVFRETPNLIVGEKLVDLNEEGTEFTHTLRPESHLAENADFGFVNLITDARVQHDLKVCREFTPVQSVNGVESYAFAVRLAMAIDSAKTQRFLDRGNEVETINYKGNVINFVSQNPRMKYFTLDVFDVLDENFTPDLIEGKVVIMCTMGKFLGDVLTREDFYFTPMNERYVGKAEHDMFGGVIHANIVSQIIDEDNIDSMSENQAIVLAIILCLVNVFFFKMIYGAIPKWYDGITKLIILIEVFFLATLMIYMFYTVNYKLDITLSLIVIALSGDAIEVYHGVIKNLFTRSNRKEIFKVNRKFWESAR
ncbi:CHASE2 domain-containing protein [Ekhidna sp.]